MEALLTVFAALSLGLSMAAISVALFIKYSTLALVNTLSNDIRAETAGIELRLERLVERRINESMLDIRQQAQTDCVDLIQAALDGVPSQDGHGGGLDAFRLSNIR